MPDQGSPACLWDWRSSHPRRPRMDRALVANCLWGSAGDPGGVASSTGAQGLGRSRIGRTPRLHRVGRPCGGDADPGVFGASAGRTRRARMGGPLCEPRLLHIHLTLGRPCYRPRPSLAGPGAMGSDRGRRRSVHRRVVGPALQTEHHHADELTRRLGPRLVPPDGDPIVVVTPPRLCQRRSRRVALHHVRASVARFGESARSKPGRIRRT
jgi:hypothetical protein